jgi:hypothetical protein
MNGHETHVVDPQNRDIRMYLRFREHANEFLAIRQTHREETGWRNDYPSYTIPATTIAATEGEGKKLAKELGFSDIAQQQIATAINGQLTAVMKETRRIQLGKAHLG